jgi:hypothetical protein
MATLQLNPDTKDIPLDAGSESWLIVVHQKTIKSRMCAIPPQYFDVLKARGLVTGAAGDAKATGQGNTYCIQIAKPAREARKAAKAKKKKK